MFLFIGGEDMHKLNIRNKHGNSRSTFYKGKLQARYLALASLLIANSFPGFVAPAHAATAFERFSSLLATTPEGGWVKASTNFYSDAWPTGADAVQLNSVKFPGAVVTAWSSFGWDSAGGNLMLWGGGHANYAGNEMYVWDGATGNWGRGSLPSKIDENGFVIGGVAPQSSHTYDNNLYLPVNGMFMTFGGAAITSGTYFQTTDGVNVSRAGPYLWDPLKADPNKVGGTTGSGWNTATVAEGGNMWIDRRGHFTGAEASGHINGTAASHVENGQDVVYLTADQNASGFPSLYRYAVGDVRNGGDDTLEKIGIMRSTVGYKGAATIDTDNNLYIRTATVVGSFRSDLAVWELDKANAANPNSNSSIGINLVNSDGSDFIMTGDYGIGYDSANSAIVLWDGKDGGTVWSASVITDADGNIGSNTTWTVFEIPSATASHPNGNFATGVLGKWQYDEVLGAFIALDEISNLGGGVWDAGVWLYKPITGVIPEPQTYALLLAGIGLIGWSARRQSRKDWRRHGHG